MENKSISIFFPAHNEEKLIEQTVNNALKVAAELFNDYEIIIINDGSSDKTAEIIDNLAKQNSKIKAVHHPINKGYGAALKSGFANSTKDLIFFTDGDGQFDVSEIKNFHVAPAFWLARCYGGARYQLMQPPRANGPCPAATYASAVTRNCPAAWSKRPGAWSR